MKRINSVKKVFNLIKPLKKVFEAFGNENIFFVDDNSVSNWAKIINSLYKNETLLSEVASNGINTHVFLDDNINHTPDSVFPNNWISLHQSGHICLYPMLARNRRLERKSEVFSFLNLNGFKIDNIIIFKKNHI